MKGLRCSDRAASPDIICEVEIWKSRYGLTADGPRRIP